MNLKSKTLFLEKQFGVDIWCKKDFNPKTYLQYVFPEIEFFEWDFITNKPIGFDENNPSHSIYSLKDHSTKHTLTLYPYELSVDHLDGKRHSYRHIYTLAKNIAEQERNKCLVDYPPNPKEDKPSYKCLLFTKKGKVYVVDDSTFDNKKSDVTILREIFL